MKRMLAAGAGRIYQVARVFRRDELGPLHNPEFTLVEWYQPGDDLDAGMQMTVDLCETLLADEKREQAPFVRSTQRAVPAKGACPLFSSQAERITYAEAFERFVGVNPHAADGKTLSALAEELGINAPASLSTIDRDGWLDLMFVERIQPHLGRERPTLLYHFPAGQAALARVRPADADDPNGPLVAERFELFIQGIELANGYHELLDPAELRSRNAAVNWQRIADGKPPLPEESRLLAAMEAGLPPSVGVALGFDRLVMLAAGASTLAEVMAFPFDRA